MEGYNVWSIAFGDEVKPEIPTASIQDSERNQGKSALVKGNIIQHIRDCNTSNETWKTLKDLYQTTNTNWPLFLRSILLSIKMEPSF